MIVKNNLYRLHKEKSYVILVFLIIPREKSATVNTAYCNVLAKKDY